MDILSDESCDLHAQLIVYAFERLGWQEIIPIRLLTFEQAELLRGSDDETVWHLCQMNSYILLTGNRTANDGNVSLEFVLRRNVTGTSLPVVTIGNLKRVIKDPAYCDQCADSLANIVWGLLYEGKYRGTPRIYIPLPTS